VRVSRSAAFRMARAESSRPRPGLSARPACGFQLPDDSAWTGLGAICSCRSVRAGQSEQISEARSEQTRISARPAACCPPFAGSPALLILPPVRPHGHAVLLTVPPPPPPPPPPQAAALRGGRRSRRKAAAGAAGTADGASFRPGPAWSSPARPGTVVVVLPEPLVLRRRCTRTEQPLESVLSLPPSLPPSPPPPLSLSLSRRELRRERL
jgi:hypothetical protein